MYLECFYAIDAVENQWNFTSSCFYRRNSLYKHIGTYMQCTVLSRIYMCFIPPCMNMYSNTNSTCFKSTCSTLLCYLLWLLLHTAARNDTRLFPGSPGLDMSPRTMDGQWSNRMWFGQRQCEELSVAWPQPPCNRVVHMFHNHTTSTGTPFGKEKGQK